MLHLDLLSPQSPTLASRKPAHLLDLEALQFPPCLFPKASPHSHECLCHQNPPRPTFPNPRRRPRQSNNRASLVERSGRRHPHHPNSSQGRICSPAILPPFFCGHAQPRASPDLAQSPRLPNHEWHQRRYLASCKIIPRLAPKTFLASDKSRLTS